MNMPTRETGTILAALRLWQIARSTSGRHIKAGLSQIQEQALEDIATECGTISALNFLEIEELCDHINHGPDESRILSALKDAHSALVDAQTQFDQCEKMFREDADFVAAHKAVNDAIDECGKALDGQGEMKPVRIIVEVRGGVCVGVHSDCAADVDILDRDDQKQQTDPEDAESKGGYGELEKEIAGLEDQL